MAKVFKMRDPNRAKSNLLEMLYGENWKVDAPHSDTALMFDIEEKMAKLMSENRALRSRIKALSEGEK